MQQKASAQQSRSKELKEIHSSSRHYMHTVECNNVDSSDDESNDVLTAEFVWPSKAKSSVCESLKPIGKYLQDDMMNC